MKLLTTKNYPFSQLAGVLFFPLSLIYLELIMRFISSEASFTFGGLIIVILICAAAGMFFSIVCSLTKYPKINALIGIILLEAVCFYCTLEYFMKRAFSIYMDLKTIINGSDGVVSENSGGISSMMVQTWYMILLLHLPVLALILLGIVLKVIKLKRFSGSGYIQLAILLVIFEAGAAIPLMANPATNRKLTSNFEVNQTVRTISAQTAVKLDLFYTFFGNPAKKNFSIDSESENKPASFNETDYNMINIDFDELNALNPLAEHRAINEYVSTLTPSKKNEYTGLFEGMNLIQITGESFTQYVVDEELTPNLYRLATKGIIFEDVYQPLWSGSTTTGEFQILTGLVPFDGYDTMIDTIGNNMYLSMGNQHRRLGYRTMAFHNGTYDYYKRYITHVNLGYDEFYANGRGMTGLDGTKGWPQSDLAMFKFIAPDFIIDEPFSIYAMTVSGHSTYSLENKVAAANYDEVKEWADRNGYNYSLPILCYFAVNLEVEKSVGYLIKTLDEHGVLDNTVITLIGDHYPYSLTDKFQFDEKGRIDRTITEQNIAEMFGFKPETNQDYHHNAFYVWTPKLEEMDPIVVDTPVSSTDILPTLSNLFGVKFDSRLLAGRDALAKDTQPLVIFSDYSWRTEAGYYDTGTNAFILDDGTHLKNEQLDENMTGAAYDGSPLSDYTYNEYIEKINRLVKNQIVFSTSVVKQDYYAYLFGKNPIETETLPPETEEDE